jgi:hypothetical protein
MIQSSAAVSGSFAPTVQFEKLEIHTVFLRFSNFHLGQNLSLTTLADPISGYLSVCVDKIRRVRYDEKTIKGGHLYACIQGLFYRFPLPQRREPAR